MKKYVLVIEDDKDLLEAMKEGLDRNMYQAVTARTVSEALQRLKIQEFFCVVTDIRLGEQSGEEVIEFLRQTSAPHMNRSTPILVVSGYLDRPLAVRLKAYVDGALVKPFTMEALLAKLQALEVKQSAP